MQRVSDGTEWEAAAGYSRAVRLGRRIAVSGTTGHRDDPADVVGDTYRQAVRAMDRALAAARTLAGPEAIAVVRTRVYLTPHAEWRDAARAHRERFGPDGPANTMLYVHSLIGAGLLVEVELDAEVVPDAIQPAGQQ